MAKSKAHKLREAKTKEERKRVRRTVGSLKSLTVQPVTQQRYSQALDGFYRYLKRENITLPKQRDLLDPIASDYVEHLWAEGEGRATASNFLAGLQNFDPKLRGQLPGSWRLMRTWTTNELPSRAPPLTEAVLKAMVGWSFSNNLPQFGISLLLGFHALLRTAELLALQAHQLHMTSATQPAVLSLGLTKSGKRVGAEESVTISDRTLLLCLWNWKRSVSQFAFLCPKPHQWRKLFQDCLEGIRVTDWGFRPYSLRRGGATAFFTRCGSLDQVIVLGRWTAVKNGPDLPQFRTCHVSRFAYPA